MELEFETQQINFKDKDKSEERDDDKSEKEDKSEDKIEEKGEKGEKEKEKEEKGEEEKGESRGGVLGHGLETHRKIFINDNDEGDSKDKEWNCLVFLDNKFVKVYKEIAYKVREKVHSRSSYLELTNDEDVDNLIKSHEFDHNRWLDVYKQLTPDPVANKNKLRLMRELVQLDTKQNLLDFCYHITFSIGKENVKKDGYVKLPKEEIIKAIKSTEIINEKPAIEEGELESRKLVEQSDIGFLHSDSIAAGLFLKNQKKANPLVLLFANPTRAGNSYRGGDGQEEDIFRRTTLTYSVDQEMARIILPEHRFEYNVKDARVIYAPNVFAFRKYISEGYSYMIPEKLDFILCAPINRPKLDGGRMIDKEQVERLEKQVRTILTVAFEKKHDSVVLGAFGCGSAKGNAKEVLKVFKKIIQQEFPHTFKYVIFSVIEEEQNPVDKTNVGVFKHVIDKKKDCTIF